MPTAIDGSTVPASLPMMACGGVPIFDKDSGCGYRWDQCFAVIGSVSQPQHCKELNSATSPDARVKHSTESRKE